MIDILFMNIKSFQRREILPFEGSFWFKYNLSVGVAVCKPTPTKTLTEVESRKAPGL